MSRIFNLYVCRQQEDISIKYVNVIYWSYHFGLSLLPAADVDSARIFTPCECDSDSVRNLMMLALCASETSTTLPISTRHQLPRPYSEQHPVRPEVPDTSVTENCSDSQGHYFCTELHEDSTVIGVVHRHVNCFRACFVVAIVATVAYSVDINTEDSRNNTTMDISAQNVLMSLPVLQSPLLGK